MAIIFKTSVNASAAPLLSGLLADAEQLRLGIEKTRYGATLVDGGIDHPGGLEAGRRIAEICMGGLGRVSLLPVGDAPWSFGVSVHATDPVLACLGSQYAGWSLSHKDEDGSSFYALGSGPGRALAGREELFQELGYKDESDSTCLVLEVDKRPPEPVLEKVVRDCKITPDNLTVILTPTSSLAGGVQIVARVLEVALHKVHAVGFPLENIVDGMGRAPLPPPSPDFITAMGRTNDAILFAGFVHLFVTGGDDDARELANKLPSSASRDYGKPFGEVFSDYKGDFFAIDAMLFSPAQVLVTAVDSGNSFAAGHHDQALLERSFGGGA